MWRAINPSFDGGRPSRCIKLDQAGAGDPCGWPVPFKVTADAGNFVVNPITVTELEQRGVATRNHLVDVATFRLGASAAGQTPK